MKFEACEENNAKRINHTMSVIFRSTTKKFAIYINSRTKKLWFPTDVRFPST